MGFRQYTNYLLIILLLLLCSQKTKRINENDQHEIKNSFRGMVLLIRKLAAVTTNPYISNKYKKENFPKLGICFNLLFFSFRTCRSSQQYIFIFDVCRTMALFVLCFKRSTETNCMQQTVIMNVDIGGKS